MTPGDLTAESYFGTLLAKTIDRARQLPLYRDRWPAVAQLAAGDATAGLRKLPITTKAEYLAHLAAAEQPEDTVSVVHTTGTSGAPAFRFRTSRDLRFGSAFSSAVASKRDTASGHSGKTKRIVLSEVDRFHGNSWAVPTNDLVLTAAGDERGLEQASNILKSSFRILGAESRVSVLAGTSYFILLLTFALLHDGVDPSDTGVTEIVVQAGLMTGRRRRFLQSVWGARVSDVFSLTEIAGSAPFCHACRRYRFLPSVFPEFLDPFTLSPVKSGWAVPVLTELFPYVSHEPLIRYWTDDLVWLSSESCVCGGQGFVPKGRLEFAVVDRSASSPRIVLPRIDLFEAAEAVPAIAWSQGEEWVEVKFGHIPLEAPLISTDLQTDARLLTLTASCRFNPQFFGAEVVEVGEQFLETLLAESGLLRSAVDDGYRVDVQLV